MQCGLASPEMAKTHCGATTGGLSALDAVRLNVLRAGNNLALLNGQIDYAELVRTTTTI